MNPASYLLSYVCAIEQTYHPSFVKTSIILSLKFQTMGDEIDGRGKSRVVVDRSLIDARFSEKKSARDAQFRSLFSLLAPIASARSDLYVALCAVTT